MKTKIIKIGNSFGIIIGKKLLDQINAKNEVFFLSKIVKSLLKGLNQNLVKIGTICY